MPVAACTLEHRSALQAPAPKQLMAAGKPVHAEPPCRPVFQKIHAACRAYADGTYRRGWSSRSLTLLHPESCKAGRCHRPRQRKHCHRGAAVGADRILGAVSVPGISACRFSWVSSNPRLTGSAVSLTPVPCRGLHGRKLETGFSQRQDLLLFGEAADRLGADKQSAEDAWIGLGGGAAAGTPDVSEPGAAAAAPGAAETGAT